jgi:4-hydroxybenzoate polyprenyltransferase
VNGAPGILRDARTPGAFVRSYIVTMRPYLLFVSGITGIAGMSFGSGAGTAGLLAIAAACFLSYGFGQALTDCFQTDTDAISSPYRPLVRGAISRTGVMTVSLSGLGACIGVLGYLEPGNLLLGAVAGFGLLSYTWFKRRWWGGPWYNAWIVCVLLLMGALASGYRPLDASPAFAWCAAGAFLAYANFVLTGYFKDIGADRATGYETLPVRFGRKRAAAVSDLLAAGVAASIAGVLASGDHRVTAGPAPLLFFAGSLAALLIGQLRLHRVTVDAEAHRSIVPVVHGYILLLSGMATAVRPAWFLPLAGFYIAFCFVVARRPERGQV